MLLPQTRATDALGIADRVRARIAQTPILTSDGERVPVTVSIGVAALDAGSSRDLHELLAAADAALYRAKASGRDQVQMISTSRGLSAVRSIDDDDLAAGAGQMWRPSVRPRGDVPVPPPPVPPPVPEAPRLRGSSGRRPEIANTYHPDTRPAVRSEAVHSGAVHSEAVRSGAVHSGAVPEAVRSGAVPDPKATAASGYRPAVRTPAPPEGMPDDGKKFQLPEEGTASTATTSAFAV
jgi:hypothetical protein